jgi:hypothetical protein
VSITATPPGSVREPTLVTYAALFLAAYAGLVLPVLAVGIALIWLPSSVALLAFSVLELVLVSWSGHRTLAALRS